MTLVVLAAGSLVALAFIARPLIFASLQSELAEARGVPVRFVSMAFLAMVGGRGRRMRADRRRAPGVHADGRPGRGRAELVAPARAGVALAAGLALAEAWGGLTLAYLHRLADFSFWITALSGFVYLASLAARFRGR